MWVYNPTIKCSLVHELACWDRAHLILGFKCEYGWFVFQVTLYFGAVSSKPWFGRHTRFYLLEIVMLTLLYQVLIVISTHFRLVFQFIFPSLLL
jgi:hypothetical protein